MARGSGVGWGGTGKAQGRDTGAGVSNGDVDADRRYYVASPPSFSHPAQHLPWQRASWLAVLLAWLMAGRAFYVAGAGVGAANGSGGEVLSDSDDEDPHEELRQAARAVAAQSLAGQVRCHQRGWGGGGGHGLEAWAWDAALFCIACVA